MTLPSYVGRYEVGSEIARGGFAVVVQAWDEELESQVAIKILHPELASDESIRRRFLEEARLLRRIRAPNVVTVHDVGRLSDGRPYIVLDFADRGTLEPRLERSPGSPAPDRRQILALVDALADGLNALHEAGLVHRDIKPANILLQRKRRGPLDTEQTTSTEHAAPRQLVAPDERVLVGDLGIAKDLVKQGSLPTVLAGSAFYQAPEQSDPHAEITPAADVYSATAVLWHALTGGRPPAPRAAGSSMAEVSGAWREIMAQGMAIDPGARFSGMDAWRAAVQDVLAREAAAAQGTASADAPEQTATCPYKGLAAYQPQDARYFCGREALIDELVRRVQLHRVLVVGGPSGSGKSSLVRAGLIPALQAGALPGSDGWRIVLLTPGQDPLAELHFQITKQPAAGAPAVGLPDLLAHPALARHLAAAGEMDRPVALCVDQFEELFTLAPPAQRDQFFAALSAMTDPADSKIRVIIAVRADFYGACAQIPWLAGRISDNQVLVGPMTAAELRRAISEPARRAGLYLQPGLLEAVISEAGSGAGALPLIAHALVETWIRREGNTLTVEGFRAAGGVAGAISQTADASYEHLFNAEERAATKRLFLRLVTPGEGTPDTRRMLPRAEIDNDPDPVVLRRVVQRLTEARLLTVDNANVQIAHEALLQTWPRLRGWIDESRDDLRTRQRISRAAEQWDAEGRDPDLLYRGTPLLSALEWAGNNPTQIGNLERTFLDASAASKTQAEALAAAKAQRTRRNRRAAIAVLSILAVGATLASIIAFLSFREAKSNEQLAALAKAEADQRFAGALGAAAYGHVDEDPFLALFLAAESVARADGEAPGYDARAALVTARQWLAEDGVFPVGSPISAGDAMAVALTPDGSLLAAAQRDGSVDLIDVATRRRLEPRLRGHDGGIRDLEFGPEGRWLASVGADGTVRVWTVDAEVRGRGRVLGRTADVISGVCFSPEGSSIATANGDGTVRLWDVVQGGPVGEPLIRRTLGFKVVEFSPDGRALLAGYNDGTIYGWDLSSRAPLFEPITEAHTSNLSKLTFSPTGDRFATASTDGTSVVFEYPTGRILGPAFEDGGQIATVTFAADGATLIGGGVDGTVKLWDVARRRLRFATPGGHTQAIVDAALSGDGRLLATLAQDQVIRLWRLGRPTPAALGRKVAGRSAKGLAVSSDGRRLAAGDDTGVVQVWETGKDREPLLLRGHREQVWALAFAPVGTWLGSADRGGEIRIWDAATGELVWVAAGEVGAVWSLAFTPDGRRVVAAADAGVRIWDAASGESLATLPAGEGRLTRAVLSPDGSLLAAAATDGRVRLWDLRRLVLVRQIPVDDDVIWSVAFAPDARQIATASGDEVVALWDTATGAQQAVFAGHSGGATDVAYLGGGATVVAADRSGRLHWWDAQTGRRLADPWTAHAGPSWRIVAHPDGASFFTAGNDGQVKLWDELSVERACQIAQTTLDAVQRRHYLGEREHSVACQQIR